MAIDTAEKRRSAWGTPWWAGGQYGITPNASKDSEWRQQAGHIYSGFNSAATNPGALLSMVLHSVTIARGGTL